MIAAVEPALLEMARHEGRDGSNPCGRAEKDPLLAAKLLALALSKRRDVDVPHSRPDRLHHLREHFVLQAGGAPDELAFLLALDGLVPVDERRCLDDAALAGKALLQSRCKTVRGSAGIDQTHACVSATFELVEREL